MNEFSNMFKGAQSLNFYVQITLKFNDWAPLSFYRTVCTT